jgi:predicted acetyltransferase
VTHEIRPLRAEDAPIAYRLGAIAFGYTDEPEPPFPAPGTPPPAGRRSYGAFDPDGLLLAKAVDIEQHNWYGGRPVPASGVAGVAVAVEQRGRGLAQEILTHLLTEARARGAAISTLYGSTPLPYQRLGYEEIGARYTWSLPTEILSRVRVPAGYATRAATEADLTAIFDLYREVARAGNGVWDRVTDPAVLTDYHGTTLALDADGVIQGFCSWDRTGGYAAEGRLAVEDLVARTEPALRTLLATLGTWAPVAPRLEVVLPPRDPAFSVLPLSVGTVTSYRPWMLRVIDAAAAFGARGWPAYVRGSLDLLVDDAVCPWNAGTFRLAIDGGDAEVSPGGDGGLRIGARGLAAVFAGGTTAAVLRRAGLLPDADAGTDMFLDAIMSGPQPVMRDYF